METHRPEMVWRGGRGGQNKAESSITMFIYVKHATLVLKAPEGILRQCAVMGGQTDFLVSLTINPFFPIECYTSPIQGVPLSR